MQGDTIRHFTIAFTPAMRLNESFPIIAGIVCATIFNQGMAVYGGHGVRSLERGNVNWCRRKPEPMIWRF
jgi:putative Ca2+/H+ antiporter (TMEM165/GDT1 family)